MFPAQNSYCTYIVLLRNFLIIHVFRFQIRVQSVNTEATQMTITTNIGSRLQVKFSPFNQEYYRNDVLEL